MSGVWRPRDHGLIIDRLSKGHPVTDPTNAAVRILTDIADAIDAAPGWVDARHVDIRTLADWLVLDADEEDRAIAAALLAAARRATSPAPRVWLPGDLVPADTWVLDREGYVSITPDARKITARVPLVEVPIPGYAAAVAAEQDRRATADSEVTE